MQVLLENFGSIKQVSNIFFPKYTFEIGYLCDDTVKNMFKHLRNGDPDPTTKEEEIRILTTIKEKAELTLKAFAPEPSNEFIEEEFSEFNLYNIGNQIEEEKAILAEREADAEREAQNPSSAGQSSNVTPGQICSNLGSIVQTDSYGQLICKFIWINRIKALVWMRY
jgi:hypothetical protein